MSKFMSGKMKRECWIIRDCERLIIDFDAATVKVWICKAIVS